MGADRRAQTNGRDEGETGCEERDHDVAEREQAEPGSPEKGQACYGERYPGDQAETDYGDRDAESGDNHGDGEFDQQVLPVEGIAVDELGDREGMNDDTGQGALVVSQQCRERRSVPVFVRKVGADQDDLVRIPLLRNIFQNMERERPERNRAAVGVAPEIEVLRFRRYVGSRFAGKRRGERGPVPGLRLLARVYPADGSIPARLDEIRRRMNRVLQVCGEMIDLVRR